MFRLVLVAGLSALSGNAGAVKTQVFPWPYCESAEAEKLDSVQAAGVLAGDFVVEIDGNECLLTPRQIEGIRNGNSKKTSLPLSGAGAADTPRNRKP